MLLQDWRAVLRFEEGDIVRWEPDVILGRDDLGRITAIVHDDFGTRIHISWLRFDIADGGFSESELRLYDRAL